MIVDTIPCIDERGLWCSCGATMNAEHPPATCPNCSRPTGPLLEEAQLNAKVCDFIDSKPLEYGLPGIVEPKREWWARMVTAAREAGAL